MQRIILPTLFTNLKRILVLIVISFYKVVDGTRQFLSRHSNYVCVA